VRRTDLKTTIISIYSTKKLIFIPETEDVYCAVRTESLNVVQVYFRIKGLLISMGHNRNHS
jgi:hypothetical protein